MTTLRPHRLPEDVFAALAAGGGGARAVRHLTAAQRSRHLLLIRGVLDRARAAGHPEAARARAAYDLLAAIQRDDAAAVDAVIRHPAVGAWAWRVLRGLAGGRGLGAEPGGLAAVAAAAAIRAAAPCEIEVTPAGGVVTLPSLGQAGADAKRAAVRVARGHAEVTGTGGTITIPADPGQDGPGWRGLRLIGAASHGRTVRLLIDDLDPYRMPGAALRDPLTPAEEAAWRSALGEAWRLLVRHHHEIADEVATALTTLVPLAPPVAGTRSATSKEAFGAAAMATPAGGTSMAATLAHEIQHAKLTGVMAMIDLTMPDDGRLFYAPWREDPRPVGGLLHGAYAHLGVAGFWRRQRHAERGADAVRAHAEFARWRAASQAVTELLIGSGRLTDAGAVFAHGMLATLRAWDTGDVPEPALALARHEAERHEATWHRRNNTQQP